MIGRWIWRGRETVSRWLCTVILYANIERSCRLDYERHAIKYLYTKRYKMFAEFNWWHPRWIPCSKYTRNVSRFFFKTITVTEFKGHLIIFGCCHVAFWNLSPIVWCCWTLCASQQSQVSGSTRNCRTDFQRKHLAVNHSRFPRSSNIFFVWNYSTCVLSRMCTYCNRAPTLGLTPSFHWNCRWRNLHFSRFARRIYKICGTGVELILWTTR